MLLVREARPLVDVPKSEAADALAPLLASLTSSDIKQLRDLFSPLVTRKDLLAQIDADPSDRTAARRQTATLLANLLSDRIGEVRHETRVSLAGPAAKRAAYEKLSGRLRDLLVGFWKPDLLREAPHRGVQSTSSLRSARFSSGGN